MALEVSLDVGPLIETLNSMEEQLKDFPNQMGDELTEWQTEDMRRRYPNTKVTPQYVETDIWEPSRRVERDPRKIQIAFRAHASARKPMARLKTSRPILRPILFSKLVKRMDELMNKCLDWRVK